MTLGKKLILLGGAGSILCFGILLSKAKTSLPERPGAVDLKAEARVLAEAVSEKGLKAELRESSLVIEIPENSLFFAVNDSSLPEDAQDKVHSVAAAVTSRYSQYEIAVIGHADSRGTSGYNEALGLRRARTVANLLVAGGVKAGTVRALSMGEEAPIASNQSEEGRALNRRTEIRIIPGALIRTDPTPTMPTAGLPKQPNPFVEALQSSPVVVLLSCLSSLISVGGFWWEVMQYGKRRRRLTPAPSGRLPR